MEDGQSITSNAHPKAIFSHRFLQFSHLFSFLTCPFIKSSQISFVIARNLMYFFLVCFGAVVQYLGLKVARKRQKWPKNLVFVYIFDTFLFTKAVKYVATDRQDFAFEIFQIFIARDTFLKYFKIPFVYLFDVQQTKVAKYLYLYPWINICCVCFGAIIRCLSCKKLGKLPKTSNVLHK